MSMMGLAASPGTAVEPTCSSCSTRQPSACRIRLARRSYCRGQAGSGSVTSMPTPGPAPATTHGLAPGGGGESSNDTISARLGISAVYGPAHHAGPATPGAHSDPVCTPGLAMAGDPATRRTAARRAFLLILFVPSQPP